MTHSLYLRLVRLPHWFHGVMDHIAQGAMNILSGRQRHAQAGLYFQNGRVSELGIGRSEAEVNNAIMVVRLAYDVNELNLGFVASNFKRNAADIHLATRLNDHFVHRPYSPEMLELLRNQWSLKPRAESSAPVEPAE